MHDISIYNWVQLVQFHDVVVAVLHPLLVDCSVLPHLEVSLLDWGDLLKLQGDLYHFALQPLCLDSGLHYDYWLEQRLWWGSYLVL